MQPVEEAALAKAGGGVDIEEVVEAVGRVRR